MKRILHVHKHRRRGVHTRRRNGWHSRVSEFYWPSMGVKAWVRWLWLTLVRQADDPHRVALGFAIGVLVAFVPVPGTHFILAGLLCWVLGGSFISGFAGTWVGNPWTYGPIWWGSYKLGRKILHTPPVKIKELLEGDLNIHLLYNHAHTMIFEVLMPAMLGGVLIGSLMAMGSYLLIGQQLRLWREQRRKRWKGKAPMRAEEKAA